MGKALKRAAGFVGRVAARAAAAFTAWSYSRYKDHRQCPRFAHWKHILKKPEGPKSPAMQRGGDIHKDGEYYLLGKDARGKAVRLVPASFAAFRKEMEFLRKVKATPEGKWATTAKWAITDFFDWAGAWLRVVLDASYFDKAGKVARVIDFKTGKIYPDDNKEQVELYAAVALAKYPDAEEAQVELWFLDQPRGPGGLLPNPYVQRIKRSQVAALRRKWDKKSLPLMTDKRFAPNPGQHCARCPYSQRKATDKANFPAGGDCQY